ncbi:phosphoglycerate kinase, partial [mine drainage metagenome]
VGVPKRLPSFAGLLVEREVRELSRLLGPTERPYGVVVGGAKVADKLPLLTSFLGRADVLLIGGALANPFLAGRGARLGASPVEGGLAEAVAAFFGTAADAGTEVLLPTDVVVERPGRAEPETYPIDRIPDDAIAQDIGPATRAAFVAALARTRTV